MDATLNTINIIPFLSNRFFLSTWSIQVQIFNEESYLFCKFEVLANRTRLLKDHVKEDHEGYKLLVMINIFGSK